MTRNVAILAFDEVEVLDLAGPFEVFSVTNEVTKPGAFAVRVVARSLDEVRAKGGLFMLPTDTFESAPPAEIVVIPGGDGSRRAATDGETMRWLAEAGAAAEVVLSICTGARLLAQLGWLDQLVATTHHLVLDELRKSAPHTTWVDDRRYVDAGHIITSAGVAAGIDAALHVVARLLGTPVAQHTAEYIEYPWTPSV